MCIAGYFLNFSFKENYSIDLFASDKFERSAILFLFKKTIPYLQITEPQEEPAEDVVSKH